MLVINCYVVPVSVEGKFLRIFPELISLRFGCCYLSVLLAIIFPNDLLASKTTANGAEAWIWS